MTKSVNFAHVFIREYPMILGDHPGSKGLPVTLAWKHQAEESIDVDIYEFMRSRSRRPRKKLGLKKDYRREYLSSLGYMPSEFVSVLMEIGAIKESRKQNSGIENMDVFDNLVSGSGKAFKWSSTMASSAVSLGVNSTMAMANFGMDGTKYVAKNTLQGTKYVAKSTFEGSKAVAKGTYDATMYTASTAVKAVTTVGYGGAKGLSKVGNGLVKVVSMPMGFVKDNTASTGSGRKSTSNDKPKSKTAVKA